MELALANFFRDERSPAWDRKAVFADLRERHFLPITAAGSGWYRHELIAPFFILPAKRIPARHRPATTNVDVSAPARLPTVQTMPPQCHTNEFSV